MAIEIIPKPKIEVPTREDILFVLSLVLLIFSLIAFFALSYYQKRDLKTLEDLEEILTKEKTKEEITLEQKVLEAKEKIEKISLLLPSHKESSNFFSFLEKVTHPKVFFSNLELKPEKGRVELQGKAEDFKILGQQLSFFKEEELIEKSELLKAGIGKEGGIEFSINLSLKPEIFK